MTVIEIRELSLSFITRLKVCGWASSRGETPVLGNVVSAPPYTTPNIGYFLVALCRRHLNWEERQKGRI